MCIGGHGTETGAAAEKIPAASLRKVIELSFGSRWDRVAPRSRPLTWPPYRCRNQAAGMTAEIVGGTPYSNHRNGGAWVPVEAVIGYGYRAVHARRMRPSMAGYTMKRRNGSMSAMYIGVSQETGFT
jgi:hypothetical protein